MSKRPQVSGEPTSIYDAMVALLRTGNPNVRLSLSASELEGDVTIGLHGGWHDRQLVLMATEHGVEMGLAVEDVPVARELAACLTAWADWIEGLSAMKRQ